MIKVAIISLKIEKIKCCYAVKGRVHTTRKLAFSNRFRDRNISVALETDLETDILIVKFKKKSVTISVATVL
jgi:hypothetical protein